MSQQVQIDPRTTVRELVGRYPQTRAVFERLDIDYCCGGARTLQEVVCDRNVNLNDLVTRLTDVVDKPLSGTDQPEKDWYAVPLGDLIHHIIETHHRYVKSALPRLRTLISKVVSAHAEQHGQMLSQLQTQFATLDDEISGHLMKEEQVLFPYIVALDRHAREAAPRPAACFGAIENPILQMEHEHDAAGHILRTLRELTHEYALPEDACPTFQAMYDELQRFENDLHQHIHLENNVLFPRSVELEHSQAS